MGINLDPKDSTNADGAATNGDKMLAMCDFNKNGQIDGEEVFGEETVDPFGGGPIHAPNGFEALRVIAETAKRKAVKRTIFRIDGRNRFVNVLELR
jgi:hypothetical protein